MPLRVVTHDGSFHADDVLAFALIRAFRDPGAELVRTRDRDRIAAADVAIDVGDEYDPARWRFDHHQASYQGHLSSAGMVLAWLEAEGSLSHELGATLRGQLVDFVDAVDNGRVTGHEHVPTFSQVISDIGENANELAEYDHWFLRAASFAEDYVRGIVASHEKTKAAARAVKHAMDEAEAEGRAVLFLDRHLKWKRAYFEQGGVDHPSDFVLFPGDGDWRVTAIPPSHGSFDKKRPLPETWAGLRDEDLAAVTGVPGSKFCHKNRFIAVFATREAAVATLERWGLMRRPASVG